MIHVPLNIHYADHHSLDVRVFHSALIPIELGVISWFGVLYSEIYTVSSFDTGGKFQFD